MRVYNVKKLFKVSKQSIIQKGNEDLSNFGSWEIWNGMESPEQLREYLKYSTAERNAVICEKCHKPLKTVYVSKEIVIPEDAGWPGNPWTKTTNVCFECFDEETQKIVGHSYKRVDELKRITCENCFRTIVNPMQHQKYCGVYCKKHMQYIREKTDGKDKPLHIKTCEQCHEDFTAKRSDARFCSKLCKQNAHNAKNRML